MKKLVGVDAYLMLKVINYSSNMDVFNSLLMRALFKSINKDKMYALSFDTVSTRNMEGISINTCKIESDKWEVTIEDRSIICAGNITNSNVKVVSIKLKEDAVDEALANRTLEESKD